MSAALRPVQLDPHLDARVEAADLARELRTHAQGDGRGRYATDASIYQIEPVGVFVPAREEDALTALQIAAQRKVPVLARGGGTSQCGQTVGAALVIDCSKHLRALTALDLERAEVEVQPGITLDALNAQLKQHGVWHPVDVSTAAQATLGGMAGNNSCGSRSIAYGNMVHNVTGIEAWLADGSAASFGPLAQASGRARELGAAVGAIATRERDEIDRLWPTVMRRVGGYNLDVFHPRSPRPYTADGSVNLAHLLVGSEGTLAFTRRLRLKLVPLPSQRVLGVVNFPTFYAAMDAAQHVVTLGPTAVELVDRTMIELARANPAFRATIESALIGAPDAILLVEFAGDDKAALAAQLKRLAELMGTLNLPGSVVDMTADKPQKELWEVRKAGLNIMMSLRGDGKPVSFIEDCAVPLEHLAEYTARLTEVFTRHGTRGTWYAHASVGTLHVRPILDMRTDGAGKMRAIAEEASALVRQFKGAYSGEHGDGLVRSEWVAWQFGPRLTTAFEEIKHLFDPAGLFNPGKIVRPSKMDERTLFRYAPAYAAQPIATALDWSAWDVHNDPATETLTAPGTGGDPARGFGKAVEMCNNNGHCRKFDAGTMCPSFRITRDEAHLTRGRANTLRLAITGQLGSDALASDDVKAALDLCVSCKGCKRECPTGVDMARMKVEFQHHYKARHGHTLRDRLVAHLPRYAALASRLAPLVNLRNRAAWLAKLAEPITGFSARRKLPAFRRDVFTHDCAAAPVPHAGGRQPTPSTTTSSPRSCAMRSACSPPLTMRWWWCRGRAGRCAAAARIWAPAWSRRRAPRRAARWTRCCRGRAPAWRSWAWSPAASSASATSTWFSASAPRRRNWPRPRCCSRSSSCASRPQAALPPASSRCSKRFCCIRIATRRRSAPSPPCSRRSPWCPTCRCSMWSRVAAAWRAASAWRSNTSTRRWRWQNSCCCLPCVPPRPTR